MTGGTTVVLGPTGRNFAAGMSGGVAYLLDLKAERVNREMVALEALTEQDADFLKETVEKHFAETGSPVAKQLLADWDDALARFSKIMPSDYKRVMEAAEAARIEGRDIDEAVMAAAVKG
jgi:glutamate synthase (NADPH/NADH) large chain